jgi:hypothetical protein
LFSISLLVARLFIVAEAFSRPPVQPGVVFVDTKQKGIGSFSLFANTLLLIVFPAKFTG